MEFKQHIFICISARPTPTGSVLMFFRKCMSDILWFCFLPKVHKHDSWHRVIELREWNSENLNYKCIFLFEPVLLLFFFHMFPYVCQTTLFTSCHNMLSGNFSRAQRDCLPSEVGWLDRFNVCCKQPLPNVYKSVSHIMLFAERFKDQTLCA